MLERQNTLDEEIRKANRHSLIRIDVHSGTMVNPITAWFEGKGPADPGIAILSRHVSRAMDVVAWESRLSRIAKHQIVTTVAEVVALNGHRSLPWDPGFT